MAEKNSNFSFQETSPATPYQNGKNQITPKEIFIHLGLFILTFASVTFMGANWVGKNAGVDSIWPLLLDGTVFAILLLGFLGSHEFGHYFAAVHHNIKTTLPYFIPLPIAIGTMGAVIRIKEQINDTKKLFDVGISGPLVGFVVSLGILIYGFSTLPEPDYIMNFAGHEDVKSHVQNYGSYPDEPNVESGSGENVQVLMLGNTLLYSLIASFFENVPPMYEMYHYPFLFAGWLGLFFTALNLTPVGQLDGGHILYSLIGFRKHQFVARIFFNGLLVLGGVGLLHSIQEFVPDGDLMYQLIPWLVWAALLQFLLKKAFHGDRFWVAVSLPVVLAMNALLFYFLVSPERASGFTTWFIWSLFVAFFVGVEHPPARYETKLDPVRTKLGWISMGIFILCISPSPMYVLS